MILRFWVKREGGRNVIISHGTSLKTNAHFQMFHKWQYLWKGSSITSITPILKSPNVKIFIQDSLKSVNKMGLCFDEFFNTVLGRFTDGRITCLCFSTVTGATQKKLNIITTCIIFKNHFSNYGTWRLFVSILQIKKLRHIQIKQIFQGHRTSKWHIRYLNPTFRDYKIQALFYSITPRNTRSIAFEIPEYLARITWKMKNTALDYEA